MRAEHTDAVIDVRDLSISFGALRAVDRVSFAVEPGGVTSVIGPNGAGKSTLFNLVSGALQPDSGQVLFKGRDITAMGPAQRLRLGMARSFQITNLFFDLSVRENLRLACQFHAPKLALWLPLARSQGVADRVEKLIDEAGLRHRAALPAGALSHGEQRRLEIAVTMAAEPDLLLLDEPTQGMSHADTADAAAQIARLGERMTVLLIEHDVDLVMDLSKRVIVMSQGAKLADGAPAEVRGNREVQVAYFGETQE